MHLESISNGLGAPSLFLMLMAIRGDLPATVSLSADTGWERDRLWNTGRRSTTEEYFNEVVLPLCKGSRVEARFIRSVDKNKLPMPTLRDQFVRHAETGRGSGIPMFGSRMGRLMQTCTDKMKIRALRQEARRMGAETNRNAQGIHYTEAIRRIKGVYLHEDPAGPWSVYQTTVIENRKAKKADVVAGRAQKVGEVILDLTTGKPVRFEKPIKWQTHYYPLVDLKMTRQAVYEAVEREGIPYLISSECDGCPHKDLARWKRTSPSVVEDLAQIEAKFGGKYFFTAKRIPLKEAIAEMEKEEALKPVVAVADVDFGCRNAICGV